MDCFITSFLAMTAQMKGARPLTAGEIELARSVFGDAIDYARVKLVRRKWWPFQPRDIVMAPTGNIHFHPRSPLWSEDFSSERLSGAWSNTSSFPVMNRSLRVFSSGMLRAKFFMIAQLA